MPEEDSHIGTDTARPGIAGAQHAAAAAAEVADDDQQLLGDNTRTIIAANDLAATDREDCDSADRSCAAAGADVVNNTENKSAVGGNWANSSCSPLSDDERQDGGQSATWDNRNKLHSDTPSPCDVTTAALSIEAQSQKQQPGVSNGEYHQELAVVNHQVKSGAESSSTTVWSNDQSDVVSTSHSNGSNVVAVASSGGSHAVAGSENGNAVVGASSMTGSSKSGSAVAVAGLSACTNINGGSSSCQGQPEINDPEQPTGGINAENVRYQDRAISSKSHSAQGADQTSPARVGAANGHQFESDNDKTTNDDDLLSREEQALEIRKEDEQELERRKREEEEQQLRRTEEEARSKEQQELERKRRLEEEERWKSEEEERIKREEEERSKREEEERKKRDEEMRKRVEEEMMRRNEEAERMKREEAEKMRREEEERVLRREKRVRELSCQLEERLVRLALVRSDSAPTFLPDNGDGCLISLLGRMQKSYNFLVTF